MKKTLVFLMMTLMVFGMVAGVTASEVERTSYGKVNLTLDEAVTLAYEQDGGYYLQKAKIGIYKAENALKSAKEMRSVVYANAYSNDSERYNAEKNLLMAEMAENIAEANKNFVEKQVKINIEQLYYGALKANRQVENAKAKVFQSNRQLEVAKNKLKAGVVAKKDVMDAEVQLAADQASLEKALREQENALYKLKKEIGLNLDSDIILTSTFEFNPTALPTKEEMVADARNNSFSVFISREKEETYQKLSDLGEERNWTNTILYNDIVWSLAEAKAEKKFTEKNAELAAYQAYTTIHGAIDQVRILQKKVEQAKEGLRLTELQYQAGLTTSLMVGAAANAVKDVEALYLDALYNFNIIKTMIDNDIYELPSSSANISSNTVATGGGTGI